ncbi:hypothetical protein J437_LFUL010506 [Ladona fulva]|uniref:Uncharacterized protein n=1 Tax=Ladona fulva TaxID=123851 RepID=A0A8K0P625_LADFU|nr:hypothetical protein J437_LFUL010506 [Ladona fulva]
MYMLEGQWYNVFPSPGRAVAPAILNPYRVSEWSYSSPHDLAKTGIYSDKIIEDWQVELGHSRRPERGR